MRFDKLKHRGVFVTATDTSIGKTMLAAGLTGYLKARGLNVGVMKPVASGAIECDSGKLISQDAEMLVKFAGSKDPWELINPYCLATPGIPLLAARFEGISIDFERIKSAFELVASRHDFVVVEGAGGLLTPITECWLMADLIGALKLPALIVCRPGQGTINHTLMTLECMRNRGLEALGFFLNRFPATPNLSESTNAEIIASIGGVPHLGSIPEMGDFFSQQEVIVTFEHSVQQEKLWEALCDSP
jgi:dethiobiotin synthetase